MSAADQNEPTDSANEPTVVDLYDQLLRRYNEILQEHDANPHENPFVALVARRKRRRGMRTVFSTEMKELAEVPNVLIYGLRGADALLHELDCLGVDKLRGLRAANDINSRRLRESVPFGLGTKVGIGLGSLIALLTALGDKLPWDSLDSLPAFVHLILGMLVGGILGGGVGLAIILIHIAPARNRIRAFGDILDIAIASRPSPPSV